MDYEGYASSSQFTKGPVGARLAYHCEGDGRPVLLLHGFPTWSWDWHQVTSSISQGWRFIIPDLLGFGFSDKPVKEDYSIGEQVDLVQDLLRELNVSSLSIVAHDYGTIVVQEMLRRRAQDSLPFQIERVALLNAGIVYSAYRPATIQVLLRIPIVGRIVSFFVSKSSVHSGLSNTLARDRSLDAAEFEGLWHGISAKEGQHVLRQLLRYNDERAMTHEAWENALAAYDCPLQLIWGLQDPISGAAVLKAAETKYPNATIVRLEDAGHYPQIEEPGEVSAALNKFLS